MTSAAHEPPAEQVPPLVAGDRLTRDEFERRYHAMPELEKAELIEGIVYMPSPVSRNHGRPHADLVWWLVEFESHTPGLDTGDNTTVRLDLDNEPQPDAYLRIAAECGGQSTVDGDDYIAGAPELVAEVALSSASYDLHAKKNAYRRNGVREYLVWRVAEATIDWFVLRGGRYDRLDRSPGFKDPDGVLRSPSFPGLWLDAAAMLRGDLAAVRRALHAGIATAGHAAFVTRLRDGSA